MKRSTVNWKNNNLNSCIPHDQTEKCYAWIECMFEVHLQIHPVDMWPKILDK